MARKAKVLEAGTDTASAKLYKCLRCSKEYENPIGHFIRLCTLRYIRQTTAMLRCAKIV